jgi:hypothetical protein
LKVFRKECEQDSFWRIEFVSESPGRIAPLKCSKGGRDQKCLTEVKFRWKNAKSFWPEILEKSERTVRGLREGSVETMRVIGSYRVARWLEVSETHNPRFGGQYEPLISFQPMSLDQNLRRVSRIKGSGVERISFRLKSHEVLSAEGSYKNVAHPLGGGRMVDRWRNNKCLEKSGSR